MIGKIITAILIIVVAIFGYKLYTGSQQIQKIHNASEEFKKEVNVKVEKLENENRKLNSKISNYENSGKSIIGSIIKIIAFGVIIIFLVSIFRRLIKVLIRDRK